MKLWSYIIVELGSVCDVDMLTCGCVKLCRCWFVYLWICGFAELWSCIFVYLYICGVVGLVSC